MKDRDNMIRIVVLDISKPLGAEVYDEALLPVSEAMSLLRNT